MTLLEAEGLACEILKQVMEEKIGNQNIEVAAVTVKVSSKAFAMQFE